MKKKFHFKHKTSDPEIAKRALKLANEKKFMVKHLNEGGTIEQLEEMGYKFHKANI